MNYDITKFLDDVSDLQETVNKAHYIMDEVFDSIASDNLDRFESDVEKGLALLHEQERINALAFAVCDYISNSKNRIDEMYDKLLADYEELKNSPEGRFILE